eukprot:1890122-Pyramimonas_sp.AAC.1
MTSALPGRGVLLQWRQVGGRWGESPAGRQTPNAHDDVCKSRNLVQRTGRKLVDEPGVLHLG